MSDYDTARNESIQEHKGDFSINPMNGEDYKPKDLQQIAENIASWVYAIENNDENIEEASLAVRETYIDRAVEFIGDGKVIDIDNEKAITLDEEVEINYETYKDKYDYRTEDVYQEYSSETDSISGDVLDIDEKEELLDEKEYKEIGDGLYMSKEDYEDSINDPTTEDDDDPVAS